MKHTRTVNVKTNRSSLHTIPFLDSKEIEQLLSTYTKNSCPLEENPSIIVFGRNVNVHRRVGFSLTNPSVINFQDNLLDRSQ